ncbi:MAG: PSD1 and planctomycete cytochrome C domain-containing protein, partial [Verrucomicrobia bacterium]|nr:PSD1 and planctomycete cytochrome C domain-containing protein [Verrucomicrobiota bacterium]
MRFYLISRLQPYVITCLLTTACGLVGFAGELGGTDHASRMAASSELFRDQVVPIFREHCLECHGGGAKVKSGFSLASRADLLKGGDQGVAVVPERPEASPLLGYVTHQEEPYMPPKKPMLAASQLEAIEKWIALGAAYDKPLAQPVAEADTPLEVTADDRDYWAYRRLQKAETPSVDPAEWSTNAIDRFIAAQHAAHGLQPSALLEPTKLLRRVWFDLLGLPPTREAVQAFVADHDDDGYEKVIDELLESDHFGERWARHWLDVARFAESHGFEHDSDRPFAYHYRDFVIRAFNEDMPYDQFVRWQIAGDELAADDPRALMATGFLGAGVFPTQITIAEAERVRYDALDDMLATTGSAMLATTIGCARCHDHKYDPIPVRDYYSLLSAFTTTVRTEVPVDLWKLERGKMAAFEAQHSKLQEELATYEHSQLGHHFTTWLGSRPVKADEPAENGSWEAIVPTQLTSAGGAEFKTVGDGSYLATGANPDTDTFTITGQVAGDALRSVRLEALADESLVKGGPGRAVNGNFALTEFKVTFKPEGEGMKPVDLKLSAPRATFEQTGLPVAATIDMDEKSAWAVDPEFGKNHAVIYKVENAEAFTGKLGNLVFVLKFENNQQHAIGRLRLAVSSHEADGLDFVGDAESPEQLAARHIGAIVDEGEWNDDRRRRALEHFKVLDPGWQALRAQVAAHEATRPKPETVMICSEGSHVKPMRLNTSSGSIPDFYERSYHLTRGDVNQKGDVATLGFLNVLTEAGSPASRWESRASTRTDETKTSGRRSAVANWLTDTEHGAGHLLARVIVNRIWQHHFGRGLVATPNDFGYQGEPPSHPELLDWLANDLIENGWQLKRLHRQILVSRVYRLGDSEEVRAHNERLDPENRFLWKRSAQRLEAEAVRDAALAVSGALDPALYGAGTLDQNMKRRSIYFTIKRSQLVPTLQLFDWPDTLTSQGQRSVTTTPTQALVFINSPEIRELAEHFAASLKDADDPLTQAYWRAFGRAPDPDEL